MLGAVMYGRVVVILVLGTIALYLSLAACAALHLGGR